MLEDIDHDGTAEIVLEGRGYDRTAVNGAALLRWQKDNYRIWWPNWLSLPYVMYAQMTDVDGDGSKEIVAILDQENSPLDGSWGYGSLLRANGSWLTRWRNPWPEMRWAPQPFQGSWPIPGEQISSWTIQIGQLGAVIGIARLAVVKA